MHERGLAVDFSCNGGGAIRRGNDCWNFPQHESTGPQLRLGGLALVHQRPPTAMTAWRLEASQRFSGRWTASMRVMRCRRPRRTASKALTVAAGGALDRAAVELDPTGASASPGGRTRSTPVLDPHAAAHRLAGCGRPPAAVRGPHRESGSSTETRLEVAARDHGSRKRPDGSVVLVRRRREARALARDVSAGTRGELAHGPCGRRPRRPRRTARRTRRAARTPCAPRARAARAAPAARS